MASGPAVGRYRARRGSARFDRLVEAISAASDRLSTAGFGFFFAA